MCFLTNEHLNLQFNLTSGHQVEALDPLVFCHVKIDAIRDKKVLAILIVVYSCIFLKKTVEIVE